MPQSQIPSIQKIHRLKKLDHVLLPTVTLEVRCDRNYDNIIGKSGLGLGKPWNPKPQQRQQLELTAPRHGEGRQLSPLPLDGANVWLWDSTVFPRPIGSFFCAH